MQRIADNGIITLTAGDYFTASIFLNAGNDLYPFPYVLENEDKLYFSIVEPHQDFNNGVVRKVLTKDDVNYKDGTVTLNLLPRDTENLRPGNYYYEAKLAIGDSVDTVITRRKLFII